MDTHFDFTCLLFLSRIGFKYQQSSFRAAKFDGKLTNPELETILKEIYSETNDFYYLQRYHGRRRHSLIILVLTIVSILALLITAFSGFKPLFFIIFVVISVCTFTFVVVNLCVDSYYFNRSKKYEDTVINILQKWNETFRARGIKFSIIRSFYVLMIHADYKKEGYKYNLVQGKIYFDRGGKVINEAKKPLLTARRNPFTRGPGIDGEGEIAQDANQNQNALPLATGNPQVSIVQDISQNSLQRPGAGRILQSAGGDMTRENNFALSGLDPKN